MEPKTVPVARVSQGCRIPAPCSEVFMPIDPAGTRYYRRARFTKRLPQAYRYAPSHFWLQEVETGVWRIGFTHFATRMLGDFVEGEFAVPLDERVTVGQAIGWVEGFKAMSDIYCVAEGQFAGVNPELAKQPDLVDRDPYDRGWLYQVRGVPDRRNVDCEGYVELLDIAIDRILNLENKEAKKC